MANIIACNLHTCAVTHSFTKSDSITLLEGLLSHDMMNALSARRVFLEGNKHGLSYHECIYLYTSTYM